MKSSMDDQVYRKEFLDSWTVNGLRTQVPGNAKDVQREAAA